MRVYINQDERSFLISMLLEYIDYSLSDLQFYEDQDSDEMELVNSLLNKLSKREKTNNTKIRYVYEKISEN